VEEHFILIFPVLIFFIPKRFVLHAVIGMGITGILCRTGLYLAHHEYYHIFTLSSFDALALGVLLAYLKMKYQSLSFMHLIGVVGLVLYIFLPLPSFLYFTGKTLLKVAIPSAALCSMALVYFASNGIRGFTKFFLENKACLYIGKIGYGLYVYHNLIPYLTTYLFEKSGITMPTSPILYVINAFILLLLATISYYAIENPIYSFRKYFQYSYLRK
jgi:peptidoglycan/LPS O-acetylase OafA/YrhL